MWLLYKGHNPLGEQVGN